MSRIKYGMNTKRKHKKVLKQARGYYGARSKLFKTANQAVMKALSNAYIGRKQRKRNFRKLWITRINAAVRQHGMSYSKFMDGLKKKNIEINRKMLSEMAIHDPEGFQKLVELVKEQ